jgi:DNA-binding transcriptional MocR family regulator
MTIWTPSIADRSGPRYLAIADAIGEAIAGGEIEAAAKLPTHRDLAYRLGVTVGTVSRAYAEAERRGLVAGEVGRGTFARGGAEAIAGIDTGLVVPETTAPGMIDLGLNVPAWNVAAPHLGRTLAELARVNDLSPLIRYEPDAGLPSHRAAGARWVASVGLEVPPERMVVTCGAQHGMLVALMAVARPGDVLLTEELTFSGMTALASQLHLRLHGVALDREGIDPDALDAACRTTGGKVLYCIPTHHNPTTATMSDERRRAIVAVARRHGVTIIEDDIYGFFPKERPIPLAALAPESVFFVTSTSKCMAPGFRTGYAVPPPHMFERVAANIRLTTWFAPSLGAEIAARWIMDGTAERLLAWQRKELAERHALAQRILPHGLTVSQPSSLQLWLTLPDPWRGEAFAAELRQRGVIAMPAETFAVGRGQPPHAMRLCLCGVAERRQVERGLEIVAETLAGTPRANRTVI